MEETGKKQLTALEDYINKVYVLVLLLVTGACQAAGLAYTVEKALGFVPSVSWTALIIFDITCLIYLSIAIWFVKTRFKNGGDIVAPEKLKAAKIFLVIIMIVQWNFILYMMPSSDFWGFAFFFIILMAFFLDYKMVSIAAGGIAVSMVIAWIVRSNVLLPVQNEHFILNLLNRIICTALSLPTVWLLIYLINRFLVNAKKDEMERNNERVLNVLSSVKSLSEHLFTAGTTLSEISQNESASAEELAATSEQLLDSSQLLGTKTEESLSNLSELNEWETVLSDNVSKVESTSKDLYVKSEDNEKLLKELHTINGDVTSSMTMTNEIAKKLSDAVKEIGVTLSLINDISSSTNLLALNASIEAARAGEAGRGFTVVAQEVGNLANSTKESLDEVENVIARVQKNVDDITSQVAENTKKLEYQNEYFDHVFNSMRDMTELLNQSVEAVNTMGDAHEKQVDVIKNTVTINKYIAESIKNEIEQFTSINQMVEGNVNDIMEMTEQVTSINGMVDEMNVLLNNE